MKKIDYYQKIRDVKEQLFQELKEIKSISQSTIGDWHQYIETIGVIPIGEQQRIAAKDRGLSVPEIAFPSEYRAALVILKNKVKYTTSILENQIREANNDMALDELEDFTKKHLKKIVKRELKKYLELHKPKISVGDIFANAAKSHNKYAPQKVGDTSYSIKCKTCGAARLEEEQYGDCLYCGTPLFKK